MGSVDMGNKRTLGCLEARGDMIALRETIRE